MSLRLNVLPAAAADLAEARDWYEERQAGLGREFVVEVDEAMTLIAAKLELHPAEFRGVRRAQIRRFPYVVYYRVADEAIEIVAILHSKRSDRDWRSRA